MSEYPTQNEVDEMLSDQYGNGYQIDLGPENRDELDDIVLPDTGAFINKLDEISHNVSVIVEDVADQSNDMKKLVELVQKEFDQTRKCLYFYGAQLSKMKRQLKKMKRKGERGQA